MLLKILSIFSEKSLQIAKFRNFYLADENHFVAVSFFFSFVKKCHCSLKSLWIVTTNVSREEALRESTVKLPKSNAGELRFCRKKSSSHNCACVKWNNVVRWNHRVRVAREQLCIVSWVSFALWSVVEP